MHSSTIRLTVYLQCLLATASYFSRGQLSSSPSLLEGTRSVDCKYNSIACSKGQVAALQKDLQPESENHLLDKRTSDAPSVTIDSCIPKWNISSYDYTITVNWTVDGDLTFIHEFELLWTEEDLQGDIKESSTVPTTVPVIGSIFAYSDLNRLPLPNTRILIYKVRASYNYPFTSSPPASECCVNISAPPPSMVKNVMVLSYDYSFTESSPHAFVVVKELSLKWLAPSNPNSRVEDLHYEVWLGPEPTTQPETDDIVLLEMVHKSENESEDWQFLNATNNMTKPITADISFTEIYVMMRCYYRASVREGSTNNDHDNIFDKEIYSNWSDPIPLPKIVVSSTPVILETRYHSSLLAASESICSSLSPTTCTSATQTKALQWFLYVGIPLLLFTVLVLIVAVLVCGILVHKRRKLYRNLADKQGLGDMELSSMFKGRGSVTNGISISLLRSRVTTDNELSMDTFEVPAQCIILDKKIGEGCFGEVYRGILRGDYSNPYLTAYLRQKSHQFVAVKILKDNASGNEKRDFVLEIDMMKKITQGGNTHVVNMLCAVTIQEPLCIVSEYVEHGDLLEYLKACKKQIRQRSKRNLVTSGREDDEEGSVIEMEVYAELGDMNAIDLVSFAYQIASGMEFLSSLMVVHRDLACRNILIGAHKNLKITDFGLSRMVANDTIYVKTTAGRLPLKWMALESITEREFTSASDVWSFGVVLWEIATLGGFPYPTISNEQLLPLLESGYRMEKPENCSQQIYQIMLDTWQEIPNDRPTFVVLRSKFDQLLSKQKNTAETYIDLNIPSSKLNEEEDSCSNSREVMEVTKMLSQQSNPFESGYDENLKETASDSGADSTHPVTNPYVDYPTHSSENLTRPSHLGLSSQPSSSSLVLRPLTSPALESQSLGNRSLLSPSAAILSTSAPNRSPRCSWNASTWREQA